MISKTNALGLFLALSVAISGTGCATDPGLSRSGEESVRYGRIVHIEPVELEGDHQLGVGAIIGAAAGGLLGSFVGHGAGREIATVAGVIGGGVAGNAVQNRYVDKRAGAHATVRLQNCLAAPAPHPADPN